MHASGSRAIRLLLTVLLIGLIIPKTYTQALNPPLEHRETRAETVPLTKPHEKTENLALFAAGAPSIGDKDACVAIVEFGDYECPYCGQHANQVLPQILRDYVKTGKVRYFFKDTPVESIHPQALKASEAALCAGDQGKYWEMHDRLFKNQQALTANGLPSHARALDLHIPEFEECLNKGTYAGQIRKNIQEAMEFGVRGTPTFFVGMLSPSESRKAMTKLSGSKPYSAFQQALDELLASQGAEGQCQ